MSLRKELSYGLSHSVVLEVSVSKRILLDPEIVEKIEALKSTNIYARANGALCGFALLDIILGPPSCTPHNDYVTALMDAAVGDSETRVRRFAAYSLGVIPDVRTGPLLIEIARNEGVLDVRLMALWSLGQQTYLPARDFLMAIYQDQNEDDQIRAGAFSALEKILEKTKENFDLNEIHQIAKNEVAQGKNESYLRDQAVLALGAIEHPEVDSELLKFLKSKDSGLSWSARNALIKRPPNREVDDFLVEVLRTSVDHTLENRPKFSPAKAAVILGAHKDKRLFDLALKHLA